MVYKEANKVTKRAVTNAMREAYKDLYDSLENGEESRN